MTGFVCGIGGANVDFSIRSFAPVVLRDSNPGESRISAGGVTRNILENLARMGETCEIITAFGDDLFGQYLVTKCREVGIGTAVSLLCPGMATTCYVAMNDNAGDMLVGMSDMRLLNRLTPIFLEKNLNFIKSAAAVVVDPNLPEETLEYICGPALKGCTFYADPVSTTYAAKLRGKVSAFHCIKPNRLELAAISGMDTESDIGIELAAASLLEQGCGEIAVSLGAKGCYYADRSGKRFYRSQPPIENLVNATGAGDAFLAGLIHAEALGYDSEESINMALCAGRISCLDENTVSTKMNHDALLSLMEVFS